ncbi:MAG: hypothetical protein OQK07_07610, partial [Rhodospirillales bacterium]|nr:hypothetical protein [Rhodospirillales bacterium]
LVILRSGQWRVSFFLATRFLVRTCDLPFHKEKRCPMLITDKKDKAQKWIGVGGQKAIIAETADRILWIVRCFFFLIILLIAG